MYPTSSASNNRILIIDDNPAIHEDFVKVLTTRAEQNVLVDAETVLFGGSTAATPQFQFKLESAYQGEEGLRMVERAVEAGQPYAIAFVDVRMPPGWDGIETIGRLWEIDGQLQVVLCTAYSDFSWQEISHRLGRPENLLILKKPFDNIEVVQLAHALTNKWLITSQVNAWVDHLDSIVLDRTRELQAVNSRLEKSVLEAQRLAAVAQAANQAKTDFLTVVSHELLTPMNGIVGLAEYLQSTSLSPDQKDCAHDILTSGDRLTRIIRQVLDFVEADTASAGAPASAVDLCGVRAELVQSFSDRAKAKGLTLAMRTEKEPAFVRGQATHLRQALSCLIDNAIRFSSAGSVTIAIQAHPNEGTADRRKWIRCAVIDQGAGIPAAKKELIFRPFGQVDGSLSRDHDGLGLSLALTRKWIESMGGQIGFESEPGRGSTFWMLLAEAGAAELAA